MLEPRSVFSWIANREKGDFRNRCRLPQNLNYGLWKFSIQSHLSNVHNGNMQKGGVFGLKYCPNGQLLVAACEHNSVVLIDPMTNKVLQHKQDAHRDCVNNILFMDEKMFASCSDDHTIAVWDLRNFKKEVFRLRGHTSWVKNIEFHQPSKQLVSSGFDDTIRVWDINNVKDDENVETRVLLTVGGLLRIRLSPAGDNLYLSSSTFREVIGINNLDLSSIEDDIGFIRAENDFLGLITKKRTIPSFNHLTQTKPVTRRNQIDRYRGCGSPVLDMYGDDIVGHSIDVHPNNSAILLHCIGAFDKVTVVHNTKRFYDFNIDENTTDATPNLPLIRGSPTHLLPFEFNSECEYLEEVSFSSCGRLIASPIGFGVTIATFDEHFNDYETHMAQEIQRANMKLNEKSKTVGGSKDRKRQITDSDLGYLKIEPRLFHEVKTCFGHKSPVLSTSFSPVHMQLASGSEDGTVLFHNPVL
uniref:DDB1- and CUL4-associated factor 10-like isoform X1 n=1 Tax=Styela clava TaxID=7725 RepID=UPI001939A4DF|nr:DDB1- and CUL4-associated factor 10-like isoform X1 [Styela clava]